MNDFKKPFKITIEHYDEVVSVQKNRSDISLEEFGEMLYHISIASGWNKKQLEEIFIS